MTLAFVAELAAVAVLFVVGFVAERRLGTARVLRSLPTPLQWVVGGAAIAPLLSPEQFAVLGVDGLVVALGVSLLAWLALPAALSRILGTEPAGTAAC